MTDRSSGRGTARPRHRPRGAADRAAAVAPPARPGPDRRPARHAGLDGARRAGAVPGQPALPHRPGHRRTAAPLRARPPRLADPRRRHQVRQHPRRRRLALRRPTSRQQQRAATADRSAARRDYTAAARQRVPAHRDRRPLPGRLRRDLLRREGRHRHRGPAAGRGLVRRTWRHRGTRPVRQRLCYRSYAWRDACEQLGITPKRTRPYRPQTNGKIERFHRTLADGWAYARLYDSEADTPSSTARWVHSYNHHRLHSALGGTATDQPTEQPPWTSHLGVHPPERVGSAPQGRAALLPWGALSCGRRSRRLAQLRAAKDLLRL